MARPITHVLLAYGLLIANGCVAGRPYATHLPPAQDYPLPRLPDAGLVGRETGSESAKNLNAALERGIGPLFKALFGVIAVY